MGPRRFFFSVLCTQSNWATSGSFPTMAVAMTSWRLRITRTDYCFMLSRTSTLAEGMDPHQYHIQWYPCNKTRAISVLTSSLF